MCAMLSLLVAPNLVLKSFRSFQTHHATCYNIGFRRDSSGHIILCDKREPKIQTKLDFTRETLIQDHVKCKTMFC
jgi:hypothetical protein